MKKKETQELEQAEVIVETPTVETLENAEATEAVETREEKPESPKRKGADKVELPHHAEKILKSYPDYESLYIDRFGCVFTADTKPSMVEGAILYKNPYYNK